MAQFICSSCNYKFSSFRKPMKCPYCGKSKTVNEEASAEDLIKEADDMISEGRL
ncbi:MAG: rubredoxin [Candidatus Pacearchaeota archaeon]